jgi:isopentenyl diphosphate isomerase/L-lactate dehydrogenase-like FMN-dependent dehydrogenase
MKTITDYQNAAIGKLGPGLADYIQKTAGEGKTFRSNLDAYSHYDIVRDSAVAPYADLSVSILGRNLKMPIMIAPTAWHGMFTPQGEAATSAAAKAAGTNYVISSFSTLDFPQIDSQLSHAWYQLLMYKDLGLMKRYIDKAVDAGCSAIVLTVDAVTGCSMCKADPNVPPVTFPVHKLPIFPEDPAVPYTTFDDYYEKYMPMKLNWDDIQEIVSYTKVPIILKGVLTTADVLKAVEVGAKAVIISNHGGRQNDSLGSTLDALASLPIDIRDKIEIYLDGGVRSGADVFKALALGAKAVFIGRPALYGLAVNGEAGLLDVLCILHDELRELMRRAGCRSLVDIGSDKVVKI